MRLTWSTIGTVDTDSYPECMLYDNNNNKMGLQVLANEGIILKLPLFCCLQFLLSNTRADIVTMQLSVSYMDEACMM